MDVNVLLSATLGLRSRPLLGRVVSRRKVVTTGGAVEEARAVIGRHPRMPQGALGLFEELIFGIDVVGKHAYGDWLDVAGLALAEAVPSRNASTTDAHLLACAWALDADIWSHDRDFAGTGWPSWSNANLQRQLAGDPA